MFITGMVLGLIVAGLSQFAFGKSSINYSETKQANALRLDSICVAAYANQADVNYSFLTVDESVIKRGALHLEGKDMKAIPGIKNMYEYLSAQVGLKEKVLVSDIEDISE